VGGCFASAPSLPVRQCKNLYGQALQRQEGAASGRVHNHTNILEQTETMNTLIGINNCDSVKKAKKWLEQNGIEFTFHDLREQGVDKAALGTWIDELGWEILLNKRSTTWKQLSDDERKDIDKSKAMALLLAYPTLIKRPVLITPKGIMVGFKEAEYSKALKG